MRDRVAELALKTTEELLERDMLVMGGFAAYRKAVMHPMASDVQVTECCRAFMAGAQHVFASMMAVLSDGDEVTPEDERRMEKIFNEMTAFAATLQADLAEQMKTTGSA